jgi:flagellum-specific ATP synthase
VVNGLGEPVDGGVAVGREPWAAQGGFLRRAVGVADRFETGVAGIDALAPIGRGARVAVIGEAGSGKTYLLRQLRERMAEDVVVIGLVGERAREASSLVEEVFSGPLAGRVTVVVASSEAPASERVAAAELASELADSWRERGRSCLLLLDSLTRYARALREVAQVRGEPLGASGFPVKMGSSMARLLERAGQVTSERGGTGSITGLYTVLVEGDDMSEPIADAARGILDGHLILSRSLAQRAHYPAIDVLDSVSRVADDVTDAIHQAARRQIIRVLAAYKQIEDLRQIGAYAKGSNPDADAAVEHLEAINGVLQQQLKVPEPGGFEAQKQAMVALSVQIGASLQRSAQARNMPQRRV